MGYKTLFEQIKTVCAWNSLSSGQGKSSLLQLQGSFGVKLLLL